MPQRPEEDRARLGGGAQRAEILQMLQQAQGQSGAEMDSKQRFLAGIARAALQKQGAFGSMASPDPQMQAIDLAAHSSTKAEGVGEADDSRDNNAAATAADSSIHHSALLDSPEAPIQARAPAIKKQGLCSNSVGDQDRQVEQFSQRLEEALDKMFERKLKQFEASLEATFERQLKSFKERLS